MSNLNLLPNEGGAWTANEHLEDVKRGKFNGHAFMHIVDTYNIHTILDIGCGVGYYVWLANVLGLKAYGIEPKDLEPVSFAPDFQLNYDASEKFNLNAKFELVVCLEVIEHIPVADMENLLYNIDTHCGKYLWFSGGIPGQEGVGHINLRPESEWIALIKKLGLKYLPDVSKKLRELAITMGVHKNSLFFER